MIVCSFSDPQDYEIVCTGRKFRFDFSERFGPMAVGKNGKEIAQPGPRHEFWTAVTQWYKQGKRVGPDGLCIWEPEPPFDLSDFVQIGKRTYVSKSIAAKYGLGDTALREKPL